MNGLRHITFIFSITSLLFAPIYSTEPKANESDDICITVFVHGIISIQPYLSLTNIVRLKRDRIGDTVYARAVELIRKDPFFFQHHAMQELGLQKIDLNCVTSGMATTAFARAYDTIAKKTGYAHKKNIYYTFGWSGLLSRKMRTLEAEIFYRSLVELLDTYYKKNIYPKLRIVGYSHGGRVALELAVAQYLVSTPNKLTVDELILIGMPVAQQNVTKIKDPLFKKVYHIYSPGDRVQPIDFFSVKGFLSNRTFKSTSCYVLPEKLTQISMKFYRLSCFYKEKWKGWLPNCKLGRKHLRPAHPGHVELWTFGWVPQNYRWRLPYYPLPAAVFIPYIVQSAAHAPCGMHHVTVEMHPYNATLAVKTKGTNICRTLPFLTLEEQFQLKADACLFKPINFTKATFEMHSKCARAEAKRQKRIEWLKRRNKKYMQKRFRRV